MIMAKVGILICSCDYYKECWEPMIYSLDKYWPDCEFHKYIVANNATAELPNTSIINVGAHRCWADDTKKAVEQIDCDYLIYFQEDYFLGHRVDNDMIKQHIQHCIDYNINYLKLSDDAMPRDNYRIENSDYCQNLPNIRYSIDTAIAIWDKKLLLELCVPGYTGWDFERKITSYIKHNNIEIRSEVLHYSVIREKGINSIFGNAIQRGMWTREGVKFLENNGFHDLIPLRKVQGELISWVIKITPKNRVLRLPFFAVVRILRKLNMDRL